MENTGKFWQAEDFLKGLKKHALEKKTSFFTFTPTLEAIPEINSLLLILAKNRCIGWYFLKNNFEDNSKTYCVVPDSYIQGSPKIDKIQVFTYSPIFFELETLKDILKRFPSIFGLVRTKEGIKTFQDCIKLGIGGTQFAVIFPPQCPYF